MTSVLIVGTGAMACLFAARLADRAQITLLGSWPQALAALRKHGVQLESEGETRRIPVSVASDPKDIDACKWAIVLVKTWQTARAAGQLRSCLADNGLALSLQNGLGNLETLSSELGPDRCAQGVTTYGATLLAPGVVRPAGEGNIQLGMHPRLQPLADLLADSGFAVTTNPDVTALLWGKVVINAAINPITALLRITNGEAAERAPARQLMKSVVEEVVQVVEAKGITLPDANPFQVVLDVAARTSSNRSSMLQDLERGAPTEIDAICGAVVEAGRQVGVATPVNCALWSLVKAAAAGALQ
jgi:2-dehydropantoate 2-reductase